MQSSVSREFALAQASIEHAIYFLEIGADKRAAAYFKFASQKLKDVSDELSPQSMRSHRVN
ncbi:hypothetical protein [Leptolyngbya sp. AN02str]|uniref:hypothetical protein n=1 Tax=Leptolyngbya sp. AN02str TaxID=3423363 RepID=UPI003D31F14D